jgi:sugar phosphate isomerase/epimerase
MGQIRSRREFLQIAAAGVVTAGATTAMAAGSARNVEGQGRQAKAEVPSSGGKPKFELGLASYTLRKFDLAKTIELTKRVGLKHIALKDMHLPLTSKPEQIREAAAQVKAAGLDLYGCGVVYMRDEQQVHQAFDYARTAGMRVIIGVPQYELLPLVDELVKEYDIKVAIHNHGPGDKVYPLPSSVYEKIKDLDKRIGLCNDIGHTIRAGMDPVASILKYADRLIDVHIKDVSAANEKGGAVEMGRGVIDIPSVMWALIQIGFAGIASFEYEKDADDPVPGLAESVGYARGVLASI